MCVVSMVAQDWTQRVPQQFPWAPTTNPGVYETPPTRTELDALKREIQELRKLLEAAKAYDTATGQPDCEDADKVALIKRLADLVGVDLSDVLTS